MTFTILANRLATINICLQDNKSSNLMTIKLSFVIFLHNIVIS